MTNKEFLKVQYTQSASTKCFITYYEYSLNEQYYADVVSPELANGQQLVFISKDLNKIDCGQYSESVDSSICGLTHEGVSKLNEKTKNYISQLFSSLNQCIKAPGGDYVGELEESEIETMLLALNRNMPKGHAVEFKYGSDVYEIDFTGRVRKNISRDSDDDINHGRWKSVGVDVKYRFAYDRHKHIKLVAFGIHDKLKIKTGKKADLVLISKNIRDGINEKLKVIKTSTLEITVSKTNIKTESKSFPDGDNIRINPSTKFIAFIVEGVDIVTHLLKTTEIKRNVYEEKQRRNTPIHAPPIATGIGEVLAYKVTDITYIVNEIYNLFTKEGVAEKTIKGLTDLGAQFGENPSVAFSILKEVIVGAVTGNSTEEWKETNDPNTDKGRQRHLISRGSAQTVVNVVASATLLAKLPEIAKNMASKMKNAKPQLKLSELGKKLKKNVRSLKRNIAKLGDKKSEAFFKDFQTDEALETFVNNPELVEVWEVIARKELRTDIDLLTKTNELLNSPDFLNRIGGKDELTKIVEANKRAVCKTCKKISGAEHVSDMNKFLDEVKHFTDNYSDVTSFEKAIADLKDAGNFYKVEGAAFMMRVMKGNPTKFIKGNIKAFDSFINDAEDFCRFDIKLNEGGVDKFFEFKSYKEGFSIGSSTYNQFTSYLKQINSLDELEYIFDMGKIGNIDDVKNAFKSTFNNNAEDIFNNQLSTALKNDLDVENITEFKSLINDTDSPLYDFIDLK